MIQFKASQKLLSNLIKYKINPHEILSALPKFYELSDKNSYNKIDILYKTPYVENKYRMTSSGKFILYQDISYAEKLLEINYNLDSKCKNPSEQNDYQKNKMQYDVEFLKIWKVHS